MLNILAIMVGGGLGAACRYGLFLWVQKLAGDSFPAGTLAANLLGCLLIGFLWSLLETVRITHELRLFLFTGLLGGFTTFSTFARETTQLLKIGEWKTGLAYLAVSNVAGIGLVVLGYLLARKLR